MSDATADSSNLPEEPAGDMDMPGRSRLRLRAAAILLALVGIPLTIAVRMTRLLDLDLKNIVTVVVAGGTLVLLGLMFVFLSGYSARLRWGFALVWIAIIGTVVGVFRFEGFTGDMWPRLALRWAPKADQLLAPPEAATSAGGDAAQFPLTPNDERDYPQFLGHNRRATVPGIQLVTDWKAHPPQLMWRQPIGAGWSAFSVVGDLAITQEQRGEEELVVCYELLTGKVVWSHADPVRFTSVMGGDGPRATPTIADGKVYAQGATGILNCLDGATGQRLWSHHIIEENGAENIRWGRSGSPLVEGDLVIVSAGGPSGKSLLAYHKETGQLVWSAGSDPPSYASPAVATLAGVRQVLIVNESTIAAHRLEDGAILWTRSWAGASDSRASTSQPVALDDDRVFVSKGYGYGSELFRVTRDEQGTFSTNELWKNSSLMKTKMTNVVVQGEYLYGLSAGILECIQIAEGRRQWKRGRFGHGQVLLVGDVLLVTSEQGEVVVLEASPERYHELARFQALDGKTWNNPALAGPYLLVRNHEEAACYELPLKASPQ